MDHTRQFMIILHKRIYFPHLKLEIAFKWINSKTNIAAQSVGLILIPLKCDIFILLDSENVYCDRIEVKQ